MFSTATRALLRVARPAWPGASAQILPAIARFASTSAAPAASAAKAASPPLTAKVKFPKVKGPTPQLSVESATQEPPTAPIADPTSLEPPFIPLENKNWGSSSIKKLDEAAASKAYLVNGLNHQELALMGDGLLDWIVREFAFETNPALTAQRVAAKRNELVSEVVLAPLSRKYQLRDHSTLSPSNRNDSELFEAYAAALVLEKGYTVARDWLRGVYKPLMVQLFKRPEPVLKTKLPTTSSPSSNSDADPSALTAGVREAAMARVRGKDPTDKLAFLCLERGVKPAFKRTQRPKKGKGKWSYICSLHGLQSKGAHKSKPMTALNAACQTMLAALPDQWFLDKKSLKPTTKAPTAVSPPASEAQ